MCSAAGDPIQSGSQTQTRITDFIAYWSAAHQVLAGKNPYDVEAVLALERAQGFTGHWVLVMRNPPWTAPVVAIFGFLPFAMAQEIWLWISVIAILLSARWLWGVYRAKGQSPWTAFLATGVFVPLAAVLAVGQLGPLVLLGVAGFLHYEKMGRPVRAGMFLFLLALKPHLALFLWVALILWSIRTFSGKILGGLAATTLAMSLAAIAVDHSIFVQYTDLMTRGGVLAELTPTISGLLRKAGHDSLQSLPALVALAWFFFYWRRARGEWRWERETPLLLLVSLLTAPYGWFFDQAALLPCVFQAASWLTAGRRSVAVGITALYIGINAVVLGFILERRTALWYVWTLPVWILMYGFLRWRLGNSVEQQAGVSGAGRGGGASR